MKITEEHVVKKDDKMYFLIRGRRLSWKSDTVKFVA